jgi:hypothetical protein
MLMKESAPEEDSQGKEALDTGYSCSLHHRIIEGGHYVKL